MISYMISPDHSFVRSGNVLFSWIIVSVTFGEALFHRGNVWQNLVSPEHSFGNVWRSLVSPDHSFCKYLTHFLNFSLIFIFLYLFSINLIIFKNFNFHLFRFHLIIFDQAIIIMIIIIINISIQKNKIHLNFCLYFHSILN